jgi:hypothetical protein
MKLDWLNLFKKINKWTEKIINNETIKREIVYVEKLAKKLDCKYIYEVFYEEGFESFIILEETPKTKKWIKDRKDFSYNVTLENINNLKFEAHKFWLNIKGHIIATNITKQEVENEENEEKTRTERKCIWI